MKKVILALCFTVLMLSACEPKQVSVQENKSKTQTCTISTGSSEYGIVSWKDETNIFKAKVLSKEWALYIISERTKTKSCNIMFKNNSTGEIEIDINGLPRARFEII